MRSQDDVALRSPSDMSSSTSKRNEILLNPYSDWAKLRDFGEINRLKGDGKL